MRHGYFRSVITCGLSAAHGFRSPGSLQIQWVLGEGFGTVSEPMRGMKSMYIGAGHFGEKMQT